MSATTTFSGATGIWLVLHEKKRADGMYHIAIDFDTLPASLPQEFFDLATHTLAYRTARGAHIHVLVPADEVPLSRRYTSIASDGQHVADLFVFAPYDDEKFKDSWRRGVLTFPSVAKGKDGVPVPRTLFEGSVSTIPKAVSWNELEALLRKVYGEGVRIGGTVHPTTTPDVPRVRTIVSPASDTTDRGTVSPSAYQVFRILRGYPCVSMFLPQVSTTRVISSPPARQIAEGGRNNALLSLLSVAVRVAGPISIDVLAELASVINKYTLTPPLPDSEVNAVLQSVGGKGYEMRPCTLAERFGCTELCEMCPQSIFCQRDDLHGGETPTFEEIPASANFPAQYYRGAQQAELFEKLESAIDNRANRIILAVAPTGSGKTLHSTGLATKIVRERKTPVVVLVPTKNLQDQHDAWLRRTETPHVVFKGRANYSCPFLQLLKAKAEAEGIALDTKFSTAAGGAPCGLSSSCALYLRAKEIVDDVASDKNVMDEGKAKAVVSEFKDAVMAVLVEGGVKGKDIDVLVDYMTATDVVEECAEKCEYLEMMRKVITFAREDPAGVIVANKALSFVLGLALSSRGGVAILDEAHELLDSFFSPLPLLFVRDVVKAKGDGPVQTLKQELDLATARISDISNEMRKAFGGARYDKIPTLKRKLVSLRNHLNRVKEMVEMVSADPDAFDVVPDGGRRGNRQRRLYLRVLKNKRAQVLRKFLSARYPNTQFVLLTATGSLLAPSADYIIKVDDVIPPQNRQIFFAPVGRMSASALRDRVRQVYMDIVAPTIISQYQSLAPILATTHQVEHVRGIVHEVEKSRAVLLAKAICDAGYRVVLYAGAPDDPVTATPEYEDVVKADHVHILHSLEDAVNTFKSAPEYTFLVSVALDTGHDFDDDDVMIQWIVKTPYPPLHGEDYQAIERKHGPAERDKQYVYDTLLKLIQMSGRTTRKPSQYSATIVLDEAFLYLLKRAWEKGYRSDVEAIIPRVVVPAIYADKIEVLPDELKEKIRRV